MSPQPSRPKVDIETGPEIDTFRTGARATTTTTNPSSPTRYSNNNDDIEALNSPNFEPLTPSTLVEKPSPGGYGNEGEDRGKNSTTTGPHIHDDDGREGRQDSPQPTSSPHLALPALFWMFFYTLGWRAWPAVHYHHERSPTTHLREPLGGSLNTHRQFHHIATNSGNQYYNLNLLPGPKALVSSIHLGRLLSGRRIGGVAAGVGCLLPGAMVMGLMGWGYVAFVELAGKLDRWGTEVYFEASFRAVRPVAAAMIFKAVYDFGRVTVVNGETGRVKFWLLGIAVFTAINVALNINIYLTLLLSSILNILATRRLHLLALILILAQYVLYTIYIHLLHSHAPPPPSFLTLNLAPSPTHSNILLLGLISGFLSFGSAGNEVFTTMVFVYFEAVVRVKGGGYTGWLEMDTLLNGLAMASLLPAPGGLVGVMAFVGFWGGWTMGNRGPGGEGVHVGEIGNAFAGGAIAMVGAVFVGFLVGLVGLERMGGWVATRYAHPFLTGLASSLTGLLTILALQSLKSSILDAKSLNPPQTSTYVLTITDLNEKTVTLNRIPEAINPEQEMALVGAAQSALAAVVFMFALGGLCWGEQQGAFERRWIGVMVVVGAAVAGQFLFR